MKFSTALFIISFVFSAAARADVGVLGFQAWKNARIEDAKSTLEKLQKDKAPGVEKRGETKPELPLVRGAKSARPDQKIQQAQLAVDIAQELNVNDYFLLYLSQFKSRDAFVEAAKKLNPEESADLMLAYQKHLAGATDTDVIVPSAADLESAGGSSRKR